MANTLAELSKIETDVLRKSVVDTLLMESNLLEMVPWETIGQLSTGVVKIQDLPSVGWRRINDGYEESTGTFEHEVEQVSLLGGDIDTDKAIARAKNTIADARAIQQNMMLKAVAYHFNDRFINGDSATEKLEFNGLKKRVARVVAEGYTDQSVDAGDIFILADAANQHLFLDKLDELMYSVTGHQPDYLLMHRKTLLALRSLLRRAGLLNTAQDMFGRTIDMYGNTRLVDIGVKADQTSDIIPVIESTAGAATGGVASSIYAVKFGVGDLTWGIQQYPIEVEDLGQLESKPVYRTRVDWPLGLATVDPRSVGRLFNFKPAAS